MKYLIHKISIFMVSFLLLNNVIAGHIVEKTENLKITDTKEAQVLPIRLKHINNFILTESDVHSMEIDILSMLSFYEVFEQPSCFRGRPLFYHISRRHILNYVPTTDDLIFGNTLFDINMNAQEIKEKIKEIIDNVSQKNLCTSVAIENGVLTIKMQIKVTDLVIYDTVNGKYTKNRGGYIIIVVKKAWLRDHWSENLIPSTIFPSIHPMIKSPNIQISSQTISHPSEKIFQLYQNTEFDQYRRKLIIVEDARETESGHDAEIIEDREAVEDASEEQEINSMEGASIRQTVDLYQGYKTIKEGDFKYEGYFADGEKNGQGKLSGTNGIIYDGMWKGNVYHGHGVLVYKNGDVYEGDFKYGSRCGSGKLRNAQGELLYDGEWRNDLYNGLGKLHTVDDTYKGKFLNGKRNGFGNALYKNGDNYKGFWSDDKKHGAGVMNCHKGWKYDGTWIKNHRITITNLTDSEGNKYPAVDNYDFLDKAEAVGPSGKGTIIYKKVGEYTGKFENGMPEDEKGVMKYLNETEYHGGFKYGKRHGYGTSYCYGKKYYFIYVNDVAVKGYRFIDQDGTEYYATQSSELGNTMKTGVGRIVYSGNKTGGKMVYKGPFLNGQEDGIGIIYYKAAGIKYTGSLRYGKKHGKGKLTYTHPRNGEIVMYDGEWVDDVANGILRNTDGKQVYNGPFKVNFPDTISDFTKGLIRWSVEFENLDERRLSPKIKELFKANQTEGAKAFICMTSEAFGPF